MAEEKKGKAEETAEKTGALVGKGLKKGFGIAKAFGKGTKDAIEKKKEGTEISKVSIKPVRGTVNQTRSIWPDSGSCHTARQTANRDQALASPTKRRTSPDSRVS